jgi:hypothetical protein
MTSVYEVIAGIALIITGSLFARDGRLIWATLLTLLGALILSLSGMEGP